MKHIILAVLLTTFGCTKYEANTNGPGDLRALPKVHAVILNEAYDFDIPSSYDPYDAMTVCHYSQGDIKFDIKVGLDGMLLDYPQGTLRGFVFIVSPPSQFNGAKILFTGTGQVFDITWEMTF